MSNIAELYPQPLWQWFDQICAIPHPSKHEQQLIDHITAWADANNIEYSQDKVGNLIFKKPATPGYENRKTVALQAHLDMVPQKNSDKDHDFVTDPIEPIIDGEWVRANGTTLGSDNGIGMSSALAVLGSNDIPHGPLEVLLTVDEEAGMTGAFGLEPGYLDAEILINTDSEQEGEVYMGCAGGVDASIELELEKQAVASDSAAFRIAVSGLKGGHSGCDIHLGRGNANKLLARFLVESASALELTLANIEGGSLRNAIPREGEMTVVVPAAKADALNTALEAFTATVKNELATPEPSLKIVIETATATDSFSAASTARLAQLMHAAPNGVMAMSQDIEGVVETSLNMGVVRTEANKVSILCLIRSLDDSGRRNIENMLSSLSALAGANCEFSGAYPGWKPDNSSPVMAIVREVYDGLYGHKPNIMVIHAGLECGLFKEPYPHMDMVSIGPTIRFPHSPDEKVKIDTVGLYWKLLLAVLENIPAKA
ncbi:aminoacyl-histidine dipeptidase [Paraferrimonas sp. SM1919]|uniref:aminoacyl-histidine dipeptidase n=1 Tax=Paraferrimonas sp. SM1919 TaxID=2662263 RepID=UPI0013D3C750|nr:aminoacyl-histidine dipeptidase [Paraferrimonas sp. SM1919]